MQEDFAELQTVWMGQGFVIAPNAVHPSSHDKDASVTYYLGVDVGGTTSTLAVGNDRREIVYVSEQFRTTPEKGPHSSIAAIVAAVVEATASLGISLADVATVGLATPGPPRWTACC